MTETQEPAAKKPKPDEAEPGGIVVLCPPAPVPTDAARTCLCYWGIRGLAQPIRLALEHAGARYDDVRIDAGAADSDDYKQVWFRAKPQVGERVPFPNLPYLLDGDVRISQSSAILRHVGRAHGLLGDGTAAGAARVDFVLDQLVDFDNAFTGTCYRNWAARDDYFEHKMRPALAQFESLLGDERFFAGAAPSVADFKAYEAFDKCAIAAPGCLDALPKLGAFVARVAALPRVAAYLASERCIARPLNNPHAQFL